MLTDRYDNKLTTASAAARDAYVDGIDRFLAAQAGVEDALDRAIEADPGFALAHLAKARQRQMLADREGVATSLAAARASARGVTAREAGQIAALGLLLEGRVPEAYKAIRAHLADHPRDVMCTQTCIGVFGLIGFSGQPGREAEQLAFTTALLPHYGEDWWLLGGHAFAQVEAGQTGPAAETVERSMALRPDNANGAHYKAHIHYEAGEARAGAAYMAAWRRGYDKTALLHCHISWHVALWALEAGDIDTMWAVIDADIRPGGAWGPPINVLSDTAAILYRAGLAGAEVSPERWRAVSDYAQKFFPKPGIAFADVHAALAHAMAGRAEPLERLIAEPRGPAGDLVSALARAFRAIAAGRWAEAEAELVGAMADHARIGGSRAQRDLIEYALLNVLLKQGRADEARRLLAMRRPVRAATDPVSGL